MSLLHIHGRYLTQNGKTAILEEYWPRVRSWSGTVTEGAIRHRTLWGDSGLNKEYPEWDLVRLLDANTTTKTNTEGK